MVDILFINSGDKPALKNEVNGTMLLATKLLEAELEVKILRFWQIESYNKDYGQFIRDMTDRILEIDPRCVSFYTLWPYYHVMMRIARELKMRKPDIVTVFGGPQASATAEATMAAMDYVDYICAGEGENTVVPFFKAVLEKDAAALTSVPGLYYRENGAVSHNERNIPLVDLNTLPYWDERLYCGDYEEQQTELQSDKYFMTIDVGRGCPFSCTFCSSSRYWKRTYRLKSPERMWMRSAITIRNSE